MNLSERQTQGVKTSTGIGHEYAQALPFHATSCKAHRGQMDQAPSIGQPCVSTAHTDYRVFSRPEISPPSGLNAPPASLGLSKSSAHSRLLPHKAPPKVACAPRLPRPVDRLPHGGRHSMYRDSFIVPPAHPAPSEPQPSDILDRGCGTMSGAGRDGRGLVRNILEVPKMYQTANQAYGGKMIVLV